MSILFGHPGGNPNSHHAALAHWERGWLEAFCVPWMPTPQQLRRLSRVPGLGRHVARLRRRTFEPLLAAPRIEGRAGEWRRMTLRLLGGRRAQLDRLSNQANAWLMQTMSAECHRPAVTAVHAYEDCSLTTFETAKRLGKACIYDMPTGYYPALRETQQRIHLKYADWAPADAKSPRQFVPLEQKTKEMELADVVLAASSFARKTIENFVDKPVQIAPYGVDLKAWHPTFEWKQYGPMRFLYVGHISIGKGAPMLLQAWEVAALADTRLDLVGTWHLADQRRFSLPEGVHYLGHASPQELRRHYAAADVFVFPSFFEGYGLVIGEALACGVPVLGSDASAAADLADNKSVFVFPTGNLEALVESLKSLAAQRDKLPEMKRAARAKAETLTWESYRAAVAAAVEPYHG